MLSLTFSSTAAADHVVGTAFADVISGNSNDNILAGGEGDNILVGRSGDDTLTTGAGVDSLDGGAGNDVLTAGAGADVLVGGPGNDALTGGGGDDSLEGGSGDDALSGGAGDDAYLFDSAAEGPHVDDGLVGHWNFDETSGTTAADSAGGDNPALLSGGAYFTSDWERGGVVRLNGANAVTEPTPDISMTGAWTVSAWFKGLAVSSYARTLTNGADGGHHVIVMPDGKLGAYDSVGGTGFRSSGFDMDTLGGGWHHVAGVGSGGSTYFYVDGTLVGTASFQVAGSLESVGNSWYGNRRFSDWLDDARVYDRALTAAEVAELAADGGLGDDTVTEAADVDTDTLDFSAFASAVSLDLGQTSTQTIGGGLSLTLSDAAGLENVIGGVQSDNIYGNTRDNTFWGGDSWDYLEGGDGSDALYGEAGGDMLSGGAGDDQVFGGAGDDYAYGGSGDDWLDLGAGDDYYMFDVWNFPDQGSDTLVEADDLDNDYLELIGFSVGATLDLSDTNQQTVVPGALSLTLSSGSGFEAVYGTYYDDVIYGNTRDNSIDGADGDDTIYGAGGNDYLDGGYGVNTVSGGAGDDQLYGGWDGGGTIEGGPGNDYAEGSQATILFSGSTDLGADTIDGSGNTLDFAGLTAGVDIDLEETAAQTVLRRNALADFLLHSRRRPRRRHRVRRRDLGQQQRQHPRRRRRRQHPRRPQRGRHADDRRGRGFARRRRGE